MTARYWPRCRPFARTGATPPPPGPRPWTALEQAEHRRTLDEALDNWEWNRDERRAERRHLRLIDTEPDTRAA